MNAPVAPRPAPRPALRSGGRMPQLLFLAAVLLFLAAVLLPVAARSQTEESCADSGIASYYAREFHGKITANGERYSMWAMTAAHQTLPFNSLVRVTNTVNRRTVIVRINDAGPFKDNRIIDLSYAAAKQLGMLGPGTARVRLRLVGNADPEGSQTEIYRVGAQSADLEGFAVQLASFRESTNLLRRLEQFRRRGLAPLYVQTAMVRSEAVHRILLGGYSDRDEAERACAALRKKGIAGMVMRVR